MIGLLVALVAVAALGFAFMGNFGGGDGAVPKVIGQTEEAARETLERAGYVVGSVSEDYSADVVAGRVCQQDPEAETKLEKGSTVNLVISKGVQKGAIPNLNGMTAEQAEKAIADAGFKPQYAGNESSDAAKDTVCKQDPAAGQERDADSVVKYWISTGPEDVAVPDVVGLDQANARGTLEQAGFVASVESGGYSDTYGEGQVMDQNPRGGKAAKGSTVTILVSEGKDPATLPVDIPNVVGSDSGTAGDMLTNAGFNYLVNEVYSSDQPAGVVISQSKTGQALRGTTITLTVSKGPETATKAATKD